jgi:hypothetical protein
VSARVSDPGLERGPFKLYPRADGKAVVVDRRLWATPAWASAAVLVRDTLEQAAWAMGELAAREGF